MAVDPAASAADGLGGGAPSDVGPNRLETPADMDMNDDRVCCEEDLGGARDDGFAVGSENSPKAMHRMRLTMIDPLSLRPRRAPRRKEIRPAN